VVATGVEELAAGDPLAVARENARRKALAVDAPLVLGADTDVALAGEVLGKPADRRAAEAFLARLAGRGHEVVGGIALARHGELLAEAVEVTEVRFRALSPAEIRAYVELGEWRERAGGYAIQGRGAALVRSIAGDYLNVVGLPLARLLDLLPHAGLQQVWAR
jgi:septum formation protein